MEFNTNPKIRPMQATDWESVKSIYLEEIATGNGSWTFFFTLSHNKRLCNIVHQHHLLAPFPAQIEILLFDATL